MLRVAAVAGAVVIAVPPPQAVNAMENNKVQINFNITPSIREKSIHLA
jgi:hypothetical protein